MKANKLNQAFIQKAKDKTDNKQKFQPFKKDEFNAVSESLDWLDYQSIIFQLMKGKQAKADCFITFQPLAVALGLDYTGKYNKTDKAMILEILRQPIACTANRQTMTDETRKARAKAKADKVDYKGKTEYKESVIVTLSVDSFRKAFESVIAMVLNKQADSIFNSNNKANEKHMKVIDKQLALYKERAESIATKYTELAITIEPTAENFVAYKQAVKDAYEKACKLDAKKSKASKPTAENNKTDRQTAQDKQKADRLKALNKQAKVLKADGFIITEKASVKNLTAYEKQIAELTRQKAEKDKLKAESESKTADESNNK